MPEYLSPGVYVEEVDTGAKAIEGVSTSTAGMVGVTERGPQDVPILVTSVGEFERWFGGKLDRTAYAVATPDGSDRHCYLPDAVDGFFANGGKRAYITRVVPDGAVHATSTLHGVNPDPTAVSAATTLLRNAAPGTGDADDPLVVLDGSNIAAPGDVLRIGDGSSAEYRGAVPTTPTTLTNPTIVVLGTPSPHTVAAGASVGVPPLLGPETYTLGADAAAGTTSIAVTASAAPATAPAADMVVRLGGSLFTIVTATAGGAATDFNLVIDPALRVAAANGDAVEIFLGRVGIAATLDGAMAVGATTATIVAGAAVVANVPENGDTMTIDGETFTLTGVTPNVANPATMFDVSFAAATAAHADGAAVQTATPGVTLALEASAGSLALVVSAAVAPTAGTVLLVPDGSGGGSPVQVAAPTTLTLTLALAAPTASGRQVRAVTIGAPLLATRTTTADAVVGNTTLALDARRDLRAGQLLRIGIAPVVEYRAIRALPASNPIGNDPGPVVLDTPLSAAHANGTIVDVVAATPDPAAAATVLAWEGAGATTLSVAGAIATSGAVSIDGTDGSMIVTVAGAAPITPAFVAVDSVLQGAHRAGEPVVERVPLLEVTALDAGQWGDRLRVAAQDEGVGLVAPTTLREQVDATHIRLTSSVGVEPGTVLELSRIDGTPTDALLKVVSIDRQDNDKITLGGSLTAQQQSQIAAAGTNLLRVRSREFRLTVELLHQRDAGRPRRNDLVIASEVFANLSMDPRHSRYVQRLIGDSAPGAPIRLVDRRSQGESLYVRVHDVAAADPPSAAQLGVRVGPEPLVDVSPIGVRRPARMALAGGDDLISTIDDDTYIGADNVVPELRTGLQSLRNIDPISIVGCPGRTSVPLQQALIDHCEAMRYRFAVLDCGGPPNDEIADVQSQRQNFDTKYASLYYPWLMVPEVFPANTASVDEEAIPPSGHMLGVYARIDVERGVHKAPANEVVRGGIVDLRRALNKSEHDILNPFPTNINVIRDFRHDSRGIRVYGARVITSDPDWKYVNVRRLLIFIEKSIDIGLQWVVFEPNAEPLWARVKRSVGNFLTTVWRNGALEGLSRDEAFFVKCDRTTMTQADIDNGRLIIEVGVAPVKPAEFVIVRIGLFTAHRDD